jgi:hypothetical protein
MKAKTKKLRFAQQIVLLQASYRASPSPWLCEALNRKRKALAELLSPAKQLTLTKIQK